MIVAALNIKSMDFGGSLLDVDNENETGGEVDQNNVTIMLDLAFASNVRYLDDHEM